MKPENGLERAVLCHGTNLSVGVAVLFSQILYLTHVAVCEVLGLCEQQPGTYLQVKHPASQPGQCSGALKVGGTQSKGLSKEPL